MSNESCQCTEMQKKVRAKLRDIAPRGQTENTTRDLRSYRVELFLFASISVRGPYQQSILLVECPNQQNCPYIQKDITKVDHTDGMRFNLSDREKHTFSLSLLLSIHRTPIPFLKGLRTLVLCTYLGS